VGRVGACFAFLCTFKFGRGSGRMSRNDQNMGLCGLPPACAAHGSPYAGPHGTSAAGAFDDACSGIGEEMVRAARRYLRDRGGVGLEQAW